MTVPGPSAPPVPDALGERNAPAGLSATAGWAGIKTASRAIAAATARIGRFMGALLSDTSDNDASPREVVRPGGRILSPRSARRPFFDDFRFGALPFPRVRRPCP